MKKLITLILFTSIFSGSLYSQSSWEKIIVDSTYNFSKVQFLNSQTGYVCGNHISIVYNSSIYKTTNSGNNWVKVYQINARNKGMHFFDASTGITSITFYGLTAGGSLRKTSNGGSTWQAIYSYAYGSIPGLYFLNNLTGFSTSYYRINKTVNGGYNWSIINIPSNYVRNHIFFIDTNIGFYLSVDRRIFKSTNGGDNWNLLNYLSDYALNDLLFLDTLNGYLAGGQTNGTILKTTNGGYNWFVVHTAFEAFTKVKFITFNVGYAIGNSNKIYRTSNAGYNWTTQILDSAYQYYDFSFANAYTGFVVGQRGIVLRTTNGGATFINPISTETPSKYSLSQNYPNPFNPTTNVKFSIVNSGDVKLVVYDIQGREVRAIVNERLQPGTYEVSFDGTSLNSSVYFYKLITDGFTETKKMLLIK